MSLDRLEQAADLLSRLQSKGLSIEARDDDLVVRPADLLTDELAQEIRGLKPEIVYFLTGNVLEQVTDGQGPALGVEDYWPDLRESDRRYLTGPRDWPAAACPWCCRWLSHTEGCLAAEPPVLNFGKHKGRSLDQIPESYIQWLLESEAGDAPWRSELDRWLAARRQPNPLKAPPPLSTSKDPKRRGAMPSQLSRRNHPNGYTDPDG